jgi:hypothetical protein
LKEPTAITNNKQDRIAMIMVIVIFFLLEKYGFFQTNGKINGPTTKKPITREVPLKYHFSGGLFSIQSQNSISDYFLGI